MCTVLKKFLSLTIIFWNLTYAAAGKDTLIERINAFAFDFKMDKDDVGLASLESLLYAIRHVDPMLINMQDETGNTLLHRACKVESGVCIKLLIKSNAAVNVLNNDGNTPLHLVPYNKINWCEYFRAKGADLCITNNKGVLAVEEYYGHDLINWHRVAYREMKKDLSERVRRVPSLKQLAIASWLVYNKKNVRTAHDVLQNPEIQKLPVDLQQCIGSQKDSMSAQLRVHYINTAQPFLYSISFDEDYFKEHIRCMTWLLCQGANPDSSDPRGPTFDDPIMKLLMCDPYYHPPYSFDLVKLLLEHGADPNYPSGKAGGNTRLWFFVQRLGCTEDHTFFARLVLLLRAYGAAIHLRASEYDQSAFERMQSSHNLRVMQFGYFDRPDIYYKGYDLFCKAWDLDEHASYWLNDPLVLTDSINEPSSLSSTLQPSKKQSRIKRIKKKLRISFNNK